MLSFLIRFSIRHAFVVIVFAGLLIVYSGYRMFHAGLDIFPEFAPKKVIIQTEAPGLTSEQVETLVSHQVETSISGLVGLETVRSESIQGLSIVTASFAETTDIYRNRQLVAERLSTLKGQLAFGSATPSLVPLSSSSATVLTLGVQSKNLDLMNLRSIVDQTILPQLRTIPGVADINVFGGQIKQLQIQIDPDKLRRLDLTLDRVIQAATQATIKHGGGVVENANQRFMLHIAGMPMTPEQLASVVVHSYRDRVVTLADIANINYAGAPAIGAASIMGQPGIVMMVIGQMGANTLSVTKATEAALQDIKPILAQQGIKLYPHLFRPADYIQRSIANLSTHLLLGGLFVIIILYAFLFNAKTAFISAIAIPVSLLCAMLALLEMGINLNIMVLGGLAIALGEVVDDAIIDTENIFRRLQLNALSPVPSSHASVIYQASLEVRSSVVYASFIVALVFTPILTLTGVAGRLFAPLGFAYILAILMSLLVALLLTPALCTLLFSTRQKNNKSSPLVQFILPLYQKTLYFVKQHAIVVITISLLLSIAGTTSIVLRDSQFLPDLREGHYIVHTASLPGTSLDESIRTGNQITQQLLNINGIASVSQWAGRAERGADTYGTHYSEFEVRLKTLSGKAQQKVLEDIRNALDHMPGILYEANTFLIERIDETISGFTAPVVVNLFGNDLATIDSIAKQTATMMRSLPGAHNVQLRSAALTPMIQIQPDMQKLAFWGVRPDQIVDTLHTAYAGRKVGIYFRNNQIYDITVSLSPELRKQPEALGNLPITTFADQTITLNQVADVIFTEGRYNIFHQDGRRLQSITCHILEHDYDSFIESLKENLSKLPLAENDVYTEVAGTAIEQKLARNTLIGNAMAAGIGVLTLLYFALGQSKHVALTLINLPFSLVGGCMAIYLTDEPLSIGSVVGFITLFGITIRNAIMLISHYQYLVEHEGLAWNIDTMLRGSQERLPSILMTSLVTALAMLPIAMSSDNPGQEIMGPMATIIIGGLFSSTLLNLLVLPVIFLHFGQFNKN
ncbi:MAG: efflux RND transporter permease subunit [Methylococcaceae bacterium]